MYSKAGKATHEMYQAFQSKDLILRPELRKQKATGIIGALESFVGALDGRRTSTPRSWPC